MKHLKRFNEELKPQTYKTAGERLVSKGHVKRGVSLSSYGHEMANDLIGFWVGDVNNKSTFLTPLEFEFTNCRYKIIHDSKSWELFNNSDYYRDKREIELGKMLEKYKKGEEDLFIEIQLYFKISSRQAELFKDLLRKNEYSKTGISNAFLIRAISNRYEIPLVTYKLNISDSIYWEDDDGNHVKINDEDFYEFFSNGFYPRLEMVPDRGSISEYRSTGSYEHKVIGIPCSRKEAVKFKNIVNPKITEYITPLIHELFSEHIQGKPEDFEKTIGVFKNQKINDLYTDSTSATNDANQFYKQFTKQ